MPRRNKPTVEYAVFKLYRGSPEYWDGPYPTLKKAQKVFLRSYANEDPKSEDFGIFKTVTTQLRTPCLKKK